MTAREALPEAAHGVPSSHRAHEAERAQTMDGATRRAQTMDGATKRASGLSASRRAAAVAHVVERHGEMAFTVDGPSMWPRYRKGATVVVKPCAMANLAVGELVVFARDEELVLHRIVGRDGRGWITRGDALGRADEARLTAKELVGRVETRLFRHSPELDRIAGWLAAKLAPRVGSLISEARHAKRRIRARVHTRPG